MKLVVQNGDRDLIKCADRIEHLHYQEAFAVARDPNVVSKSGQPLKKPHRYDETPTLLPMMVALKTGFEWFGSDENVKCRDLCVHIKSDTAKHVGRHAGVSYACHKT